MSRVGLYEREPDEINRTRPCRTVVSFRYLSLRGFPDRPVSVVIVCLDTAEVSTSPVVRPREPVGQRVRLWWCLLYNDNSLMIRTIVNENKDSTTKKVNLNLYDSKLHL